MDAAELEWIAWTTPITTSFGTAVAASDFSGRTVTCRQPAGALEATTTGLHRLKGVEIPFPVLD